MAELEDYTIEVLEKEGKTIIPVTTTQAVMTSSGRYLEESIVEMEDVSEGEIVDISPEVEINPSIPSGAEVISCSSMRVGEKYYSMSSVEANPEIPEGTTPTALENLQIGNEYYAPASSGGGGEVYMHVIHLSDTGSSGVMMDISILSSETTPFDYSKICSFLKDHDHTHYYKPYPNALGSGYRSGVTYVYLGLYYYSDYLTAYCLSYNQSNFDNVKQISKPPREITDTVYDMEGNLV